MSPRLFVCLPSSVASPVSAGLVLLLTVLPLAGCRHRVITQPDTIHSRGADAGQYTREEYFDDLRWYKQAIGYPQRDVASPPQGGTPATAQTGTPGTPQKDDAGAAAVAHGSMDLAQAKMARNSIVFGLMGQIDLIYSEYYRHTFAGKNAVGIVGDVLVLGLGASGTIATNVATKTIFTALGTSFSGINLSIDKNLYAQQSFQVIGIAMQTRRDKVRAYIVQSLAQDVTDYPLAEAKRDLISYMSAGTLAAGLQELQEEAGAATVPKTSTSALPAAPAAPANLYALAGGSSVTLVWTPVAGATGYTVYRSSSSDVSAASGLQLVQVPDSAFEDKRAPAASSYYVVTAVNAGGESTASSAVSAQPTGAAAVTAIAPPASVQVVGSGTEDVVGWPSVPGAKAYAVKFAQTADTVDAATPQTGLATPFFLHKNIPAGQTFFYKVAATDMQGNLSAYTAAASTAAAAPVTPPATAVTPTPAPAPPPPVAAPPVQAVAPAVVRTPITTPH